MKNKFILLLLLLLSLINNVLASEIYFESGEIKISDDGNTIKSSKGKAWAEEDKMTISANKFHYDKSLTILIAKGDSIAFFKDKNISISADKFIYNKNLQTLDSIGNVLVNHLSKKILLKSQRVFYDIKKNEIRSRSKSTINDYIGNLFYIYVSFINSFI